MHLFQRFQKSSAKGLPSVHPPAPPAPAHLHRCSPLQRSALPLCAPKCVPLTPPRDDTMVTEREKRARDKVFRSAHPAFSHTLNRSFDLMSVSPAFGTVLFLLLTGNIGRCSLISLCSFYVQCLCLPWNSIASASHWRNKCDHNWFLGV